MDKFRYELYGIRMEIAGLLFLFIATAWEIKFTNRWDQGLSNWQSRIDDEVNITILETLADIADIAATENLQERDQMAKKVTSTVVMAANTLQAERLKKEKEVSSGQASWMNNVRYSLFLLGAFFLFIGKWLSHEGVSKRGFNAR